MAISSKVSAMLAKRKKRKHVSEASQHEPLSSAKPTGLLPAEKKVKVKKPTQGPIDLKKEEVEQIDEISFDKATEYTKKAYKSREKAATVVRQNNAWKAVDPQDNPARDTDTKKALKTVQKRTKGLKSAHNKTNGMYGEEMDRNTILELARKTLKSYQKKATTSSERAWNKSDKEEDKAMSTDGNKYPDKQARHQANANAANKTWNKRRKGLEMVGKQLKTRHYKEGPHLRGEEVEQIVFETEFAQLTEDDLHEDKHLDQMSRHERAQYQSHMSQHHAAMAQKCTDYAHGESAGNWHKLAAMHMHKAATHANVVAALKSKGKKSVYGESVEYTLDEETIEELFGKGSLEKIAAHHTKQQRINSKIANVYDEHGEEDDAMHHGMKSAAHSAKRDRAGALVTQRNAHNDVKHAKTRLAATKARSQVAKKTARDEDFE